MDCIMDGELLSRGAKEIEKAVKGIDRIHDEFCIRQAHWHHWHAPIWTFRAAHVALEDERKAEVVLEWNGGNQKMHRNERRISDTL